jgi:predicted outer membrane repeat protein
LNHWFAVVAEATREGGSDTMMMVFNNESEHGGGISFSTFSIFSSLVFSQSRK